MSIYIVYIVYINILIFVKSPTDSLDNTRLTKEKEYSINFTEKQFFFLTLHYNWRNSYIFVAVVEI